MRLRHTNWSITFGWDHGTVKWCMAWPVQLQLRFSQTTKFKFAAAITVVIVEHSLSLRKGGIFLVATVSRLFFSSHHLTNKRNWWRATPSCTTQTISHTSLWCSFLFHFCKWVLRKQWLQFGINAMTREKKTKSSEHSTSKSEGANNIAVWSIEMRMKCDIYASAQWLNDRQVHTKCVHIYM